MYYTCMYASSTQPKLSTLFEHCLLSKLPLAPDFEDLTARDAPKFLLENDPDHYSILLSSNYSSQLKSCHQCGSQRSTCRSPAMYNADTQPLALQTQRVTSDWGPNVSLQRHLQWIQVQASRQDSEEELQLPTLAWDLTGEVEAPEVKLAVNCN